MLAGAVTVLEMVVVLDTVSVVKDVWATVVGTVRVVDTVEMLMKKYDEVGMTA